MNELTINLLSPHKLLKEKGEITNKYCASGMNSYFVSYLGFSLYDITIRRENCSEK